MLRRVPLVSLYIFAGVLYTSTIVQSLPTFFGGGLLAGIGAVLSGGIHVNVAKQAHGCNVCGGGALQKSGLVNVNVGGMGSGGFVPPPPPPPVMMGGGLHKSGVVNVNVGGGSSGGFVPPPLPPALPPPPMIHNGVVDVKVGGGGCSYGCGSSSSGGGSSFVDVRVNSDSQFRSIPSSTVHHIHNTYNDIKVSVPPTPMVPNEIVLPSNPKVVTPQGIQNAFPTPSTTNPFLPSASVSTSTTTSSTLIPNPGVANGSNGVRTNLNVKSADDPGKTYLNSLNGETMEGKSVFKEDVFTLGNHSCSLFHQRESMLMFILMTTVVSFFFT